MALETHSSTEIGKTVIGIVAFVAFVVIMLTKVPDWISPQGTNGTGNQEGPGVGRTVRMLQ